MRVLLYTILFLFSVSAKAQTLKTVGFANDPSNGHYGRLNLAILAAQDGDTLQVYPGDYRNEGVLLIDKGLTLIGPGFSHPQNYLGYNSSLTMARLQSLVINASAKSVVIRGFSINQINTEDVGSIALLNNNLGAIVIERSGIAIVSGNIITSVRLKVGVVNSTSQVYSSVQIYNTEIAYVFNNIITPVTSNNNNRYSFYTSSYSAQTTSTYVEYAAVGDLAFNNNYFGNRFISSGSYLFHSNIVGVNGGNAGYYQGQLGNVSNNVGVSQVPASQTATAAPNYIGGINLDSVFVDFNGTNGYSIDGRYQLSPNSQARGAGLNGTDCGPFGGDNPYQLSGISDIPFVWQLNVPQQASQGNGVDVGIKVKATN